MPCKMVEWTSKFNFVMHEVVLSNCSVDRDEVNCLQLSLVSIKAICRASSHLPVRKSMCVINV